MEERSLFYDSKVCSVCRKSLPANYEDDMCPACKENELFSRVKEYIRSNEVTEYDVAEEFDIPVRKVKGWIREGRIEYKDLPERKQLQNIRCLECGAPIQFGNYCQACYKLKNNVQTTYVMSSQKKKDDKMRFLE